MPNSQDKPDADVAGPGGANRRRWRRFALMDARGTLSWEEDGRVSRCPAVVSDISEGGLAVRTARAPVGVREVRLELESLSAVMPPWKLELVGPPKAQSGQFLVPLKFTHGIRLDAVLDQYHAGRMWQRYPTQDLAANLTWYESSGEVSIVGEITNISGGGAALTLSTEKAPPMDREIYLELRDGALGVEPVEARVVAVSVNDSGVTIARLWFMGPCPIELFDIARRQNEVASG